MWHIVIRTLRRWRWRRALQWPQPQEAVAVWWYAFRHKFVSEISKVRSIPHIPYMKAALRSVSNILKIQRDCQRGVKPVEEQYGPVAIGQRASELFAVRPALALAANTRYARTQSNARVRVAVDADCHLAQ
jgi:hypothetical protein